MSKLVKIVVIGDSLAMPRSENGELVKWEKTWPILLKRSLGVEHHEVINFSKRAYETTWLNGDFTEAIEFIRPDVLIVQVGVVDASPRIVSKQEKRLFSRFFFPKKLATLIVNYRKKERHRITGSNPLKKVYTPPAIFKSSRTSFFLKSLDFNPNLKIIQVPILANLSMMESKSPGYFSNINHYNYLIQELNQAFRLPSLAEIQPKIFPFPNEFFLSDGYHLNEKGHERLADCIGMAISYTKADGEAISKYQNSDNTMKQNRTE